MSSHIQLVEDGRVIGLDGHAWAPARVNTWTGLPFEMHEHMRKGEVAHRYNPNPLVFVRYGARGQSRIVSEKRTYDLTIDCGQVDVFPAGFQMDHGWWDCTPGQLIAVELSAETLHELLQEEGKRFKLKTTLSGCDPSLARLISCIRTEIMQGCLSGGLFADGLSLALVGYLQTRHAAIDAAPPPRHRLSKAQVKLLSDFVEARLGSDLRVVNLAAVVNLSPHYLTRLFSASFGMTPHRYVLQRRLEAGRRMLKTDAPIAHVAYSLGFSSQAHFTAAFRRYTGSTPARLRSE
jgi:AraC family transcriptional regulator